MIAMHVAIAQVFSSVPRLMPLTSRASPHLPLLRSYVGGSVSFTQDCHRGLTFLERGGVSEESADERHTLTVKRNRTFKYHEIRFRLQVHLKSSEIRSGEQQAQLIVQCCDQRLRIVVLTLKLDIEPIGQAVLVDDHDGLAEELFEHQRKSGQRGS